MHSDIFTKPIGRFHYLLANIFIGVVAMGAMYLILGSGSRRAILSNEKMLEILPILLLLGVVKIVVAYKRLRDITLNPKAVYWLLIPLSGLVFSLINPTSRGLNISSLTSPNIALLGLPIALIGLANSIFGLVLLFKKGKQVKTSDILTQKST